MNYKSIRLSIEGMGCASCVGKIEQGLLSTDGVQSATVNLVDRTARVEVSANVLDATIVGAIEAAGSYHASVLRNAADEQEKASAAQAHLNHKIKQSALALLTGVSLMVASMLGILPDPSATGFWLVVGLLTTAVMVYSGAHFFLSAWNGFKHQSASMDTLVAMGTGMALVYSMLVVLAPDLLPEASRHMYFEAALIVIALVNIGHVLEARARGNTNQAIEKLMGLQAKKARIKRGDSEVDIAIEAVNIGDVVHVRAGERIPVDGIVTQGLAYIDESMLTGEAMPVPKDIGAEVVAGTINGQSSFYYTTTRIGADTVLAHIIETVRKAQSAKPEIAKLVDRIAAVFVPMVLLIALLTAIFWLLYAHESAITIALVTSMSIVLIACPCALGLATPISMIVGIGKAAEHGILIRRGEALETTSRLTTIVLDKTGTITLGKPKVTDHITAEGWTENDVLSLAASVEHGSEHPLAKAVLDESSARNIDPMLAIDFAQTPGLGAIAQVNKQRVLLGNAAWLHQHQVPISTDWQSKADALAQAGKSPVFISYGQHLVGMIAVSDPIKDDAAQAITQLKKSGLRVVMLTGDHRQTAQTVAKQVGIDDVYAELSPEGKDAMIAQLQASGEMVGMVGDGINDAAALARADVGFAIAQGSDIAIESADIVLLRASLQAIPDAIAISAATLRNIQQNLGGAFIYNMLAIPIAAGVLFPAFGILLNPMLAGAAMALSSVTVVSNANRLRFFRP